MMVPVSIGRTTAEANARAEADPAFRDVGDPRDVGVFGTLEQCQERVIELAHAGVSDLRCVVPNAPDMPDVLAQLTRDRDRDRRRADARLAAVEVARPAGGVGRARLGQREVRRDPLGRLLHEGAGTPP